MGETGINIFEKMQKLTGDWKSATVLGTALLYVLGYLSLRFHITALGVSTELAILDERYLFAGARAVIYLALSFCVLIMVCLFVTAIGYGLVRIASITSSRPPDGPTAAAKATNYWWSLGGIVIALAAIQFLMIKSLAVSDVILTEKLPGPEWLRFIMLVDSSGVRELYFSALWLTIVVTIGMFIYARSRDSDNRLSQFLQNVLLFLIVIQLCFLPVNHGILIADKMIPWVDVPTGIRNERKSKLSWLVWEGRESVVFAVWDMLESGGRDRSLVSLSTKAVAIMEVKGRDYSFRTFFTDQGYSEGVRRVLQNGFAIDTKNSEGETLLIKSVKNGYAKSTQLLLSRGADPNVPDNAGITALKWAERSLHPEVKNLLLNHGARQ